MCHLCHPPNVFSVFPCDNLFSYHFSVMVSSVGSHKNVFHDFHVFLDALWGYLPPIATDEHLGCQKMAVVVSNCLGMGLTNSRNYSLFRFSVYVYNWKWKVSKKISIAFSKLLFWLVHIVVSYSTFWWK